MGSSPTVRIKVFDSLLATWIISSSGFHQARTSNVMDLPFFVTLMAPALPPFRTGLPVPENTKPRAASARGVTCPVTKRLSSTAGLKSILLEEVPCPEPPRQLSLPEPGKRWTRRDSNPHLVTGQVNVLPLHHGPFTDPTGSLRPAQGHPSQRAGADSGFGTPGIPHLSPPC